MTLCIAHLRLLYIILVLNIDVSIHSKTGPLVKKKNIGYVKGRAAKISTYMNYWPLIAFFQVIQYDRLRIRTMHV